MICPLYKAVDWFKTTKLASLLFYYGGRFEHFGPITVKGKVASCIHRGTDGDTYFDLMAPRIRWHCEVTPCQPAELRSLVSALAVGAKIEASGLRTFDPNHHILWWTFPGGMNEIHPLRAVKVLK